HGEQALLPHREGHVVEEDLAAPVDGDGEVLDVQGDLAGVDVLLEFVADQAERGVADADDVAGADGGAGDGRAVEVGAVVAAEVGDLVAAVGQGPQFGVAPGDHEVVEDEVVVGAAADADGAGGQRPDLGGPAVGAGEGRVRHGREAFRGGRRGVGEDGAGSGVGAAEADDAAGADVAGGDALSVGVGAVGAVLVLQGPVAVRGAEHRVVPGDPGVVDDDVAQRVASDVVV